MSYRGHFLSLCHVLIFTGWILMEQVSREFWGVKTVPFQRLELVKRLVSEISGGIVQLEAERA
jgi:hypothetical protein